MDEKTIIRCESCSTFSSIVGNVTSFASNYIQKKFGRGYFKKVIISEEMNSLNLDEGDIQKYELPYLVIKPELALDNTFMETLPYWYNSYHYIAKGNNRRNYYSLIKDEEHGIYMYSIPSRIKLNFNINIRVETVMYMHNLMHSIRSKFETNGFEFINNVNLQTEIPKVMMINLAQTLGLDLSTVEGRTEFNSYLSKNSYHGIEENINMSSGNNMYAYNYFSNILVNYPELVSGDKNVKNLVVEDCLVKFMFSMELWIPNKYLLELPNNRTEIQEVLEEDNSKFKFNIVLENDYILPKIENRHLLIKKSFLPDVNVEYDSLNFSGIISKEINSALDRLRKENALTEQVFQVMVMCGNRILPKESYKINYSTYTVHTNSPMINTTYTLLIYGDLEILNTITKQNNYDIAHNKNNE